MIALDCSGHHPGSQSTSRAQRSGLAAGVDVCGRSALTASTGFFFSTLVRELL